MLTIGQDISVQLRADVSTTGTVRDVSRFGICVEYTNEDGIVCKHWFSPSALPGTTGRYIDRFGAAIVGA